MLTLHLRISDYEFDAAGNMTACQTANLRAVDADGKTRYTYDIERLAEIIPPQ